MASSNGVSDPPCIPTITILGPSSDIPKSAGIPPSPTLSTYSSVHFQTSLALRENRPESSGLTSLALWSPPRHYDANESIASSKAGNPNMAESANQIDGAIEPTRKVFRRANACDNCRRRKIKCDGIKPICMPCRRDGQNEDLCCGKAFPGASIVDVAKPGGGITYNITNNTYYGTVNNVGSIERAVFGDTKEGPVKLPSIHEMFPEHLRSRSPPGDPTKVASVTPPATTVPCNPPNAFVTFSSALVRAQYSSESVNMTDEATSEIVLATWESMSSEDRVRIGEEAERADELHLAMIGSEKMAARGEVQKDKYWSFTSRMTNFWLQKWTQAQAAVKSHLRKLGKDMLMLRTDTVAVNGVFEPAVQNPIHTTFALNSAGQRSDAKRQVFRDWKRSPDDAPRAPSVIQRIVDRFGKRNAREETGMLANSATLVP